MQLSGHIFDDVPQHVLDWEAAVDSCASRLLVMIWSGTMTVLLRWSIEEAEWLAIAAVWAASGAFNFLALRR